MSGGLSLIGLLAIMAGTLLLVPPVGEFAVDDDWAYAQAVQRLLGEGVYRHAVWIDTSFLAQAWWGAGVARLLGFSHTSLRISTLILAAAALLLFFALLRRVLRPPLALMMTLLLLFHPLMLHLSYSFMTDVPFLAVMLAAIWCVTVAMETVGRARLGWLAAGSALIGLACLVRQIGVVLLPAVLLGMLPELRAASAPRARLLMALIVPCTLILATLLLPDSRDVTVEVRVLDELWAAHPADLLRVAIRASASTAMLLGLTVVPAAPLILLRPRCLAWTARRWLVAGGLLVLLTAVLLSTSGTLSPLFGNTLSPAGFSVSGLHPRSISVDGPIAAALIACSLIGALVLIVALTDGVEIGQGPVAIRLLGLSALGVLALTLGYGALGGPVNGLYDRYLLPVVPGALALIAFTVQRQRWAVPVIAVGALAFASWSISWERDYLQRQAAIWEVAQTLTREGVSPIEIDAGYEWNGWYRGEMVVERARVEVGRLGEPRRFVQLVVDGIYEPRTWYVGFGPLGPGCTGRPRVEASHGSGWPVYVLRRCPTRGPGATGSQDVSR